jgi:hypothetical protein
MTRIGIFSPWFLILYFDWLIPGRQVYLFEDILTDKIMSLLLIIIENTQDKHVKVCLLWAWHSDAYVKNNSS